MNTCQDTREHHSTDLMTVFIGRPAPVTLCGYHATANTAGHRHVPAPTCAGCFRPVIWATDHAKGCPTGQNGSPDYRRQDETPPGVRA